MMKNLKNLLTIEQLNEMIEAINENNDFSFDQNGLQINLKNGQLSITYDPSAEIEREKFLNLLQDIDDNTFIEICDAIGSDKLHNIQTDINNKNIEIVRKGIDSFKKECVEFLTNKINTYTKCLHKLNK